MSLNNAGNSRIDCLYPDFNFHINEENEFERGDNSSLTVRKQSSTIEENNNDIDELTNKFSKMGNSSRKGSNKINNESGDFNFGGKKLSSREERPQTAENEISHYIEQPNKSNSGPGSSEYDYELDDFEEDIDVKHNTTVDIVSELTENAEVTLPNKSVQRESILRGPSRSDMNLIGRFHDKSGIEEIPQCVEKEYSIRSHSRSSGSTIRKQRKINMSFSNERTMEIERENGLLLRKILRSNSSKSKTISSTLAPPPRKPGLSIERRRAQDKIQHENLILLRKIQKAKPTAVSMRK